MSTEIEAADYLTLAPRGGSIAAGGQAAHRASQAVRLGDAGAGTDQALQIHGGMGLMDDLPLERLWRDARVERIWDGTSEIQRHIISRDLLRPLGG